MQGTEKPDTTHEAPEARLKRLTMRSWRRGMREMDLILGAFAQQHLRALSPAELSLYEALLDQADQDLFRWISGQQAPPAAHAGMVQRITKFTQKR